MGGKKKENRTKGNVKPSSSARAAEFLEHQGATGSGFIGFSSLVGDAAYVPVHGNDEIDNTVDIDFRLCLKKFTKKDSVTKIKALREFCDLCSEKDIEQLKSILTFWPRIYLKLAMDFDRKVRELSHLAQHCLAIKLKKLLTPFLKKLIIPWLMGICDTDVTVIKTANSGFDEIFPGDKRNTALIFCAESIINNCVDTILTQTPQSLNDTCSTNDTDIQAKYERTISSSMLIIKLLLIELKNTENQTINLKLTEILASTMFWKFSKSTSSIIRAAFYSLISALCKSQTKIFNTYSEKCSQTILYNVDDSDLLVVKSLWEAVLSVISYIMNWEKHVNLRKGTLPKIWQLLRNGANGSAVEIMPNILPFISKLSTEYFCVQFFKEFFNNIFIGLKIDKMKIVGLEVSAIIRCLFEVSSYILNNCSLDHLELKDYVINKIENLLEDSLSADYKYLQSPIINYGSKFWQNFVHSKDYPYCDDIWTILGNLIIKEFCKEDNVKSILFCAELLCAIGKTSESTKKSLQFKTDDELQQTDNKPNVIDITDKCEKFFNVILKCLKWQCISTTTNEGFQNFYIKIMLCYSSESLLFELYGNDYSEKPFVKYCRDILLPLIVHLHNDKVIILFSRILENINDEERISIIESCFLNLLEKSEISKIELLFKTLMKIKSLNSTLQSLYATKSFMDYLNKLLKRFWSYESKDQLWNVLNICFDEKSNLTIELFHILLNSIIANLPEIETLNYKSNDAINTLELCTEISIWLYNNIKMIENINVDKLILYFFECLSYSVNFSNNLIDQLKLAWKNGMHLVLFQMSSIDKFQDTSLFKNFCSLLTCMINSCNTVYCLNVIADGLKIFFRNIYDSKLNQVLEILMLLPFDFNSTIFSQWQDKIIIETNPTYLNIIPLKPIKDNITIIPKCVTSIAICIETEYFVRKFCFITNDKNDNLDYLQNRMVNCWAAIGYCYAIFQENDNELTLFEKQLERNWIDLFNILNNEEQKNIIKFAFELAANNKDIYFWGFEYLLKFIQSNISNFVDKFILNQIFKDYYQCSKIKSAVWFEFKRLEIHYLMNEAGCISLCDDLTKSFNKFEQDQMARYDGCIGYFKVLNSLISNLTNMSNETNKAICNFHLNLIAVWKEEWHSFYIFLKNNDFKKCEWIEIQWNIELIKFYQQCVLCSNLERNHWDIILCGLASFVDTIVNDHLINHLPSICLSIETFKLCTIVGKYFKSSVGILPELMDEWENFYTVEISLKLLKIFVFVTKHIAVIKLFHEECLIKNLIEAIQYMPSKHFLMHDLEVKLDADCQLPDNIVTILNHLCPLLERTNIYVVHGSAVILEGILKIIPYKNDEEDEKSDSRSPPNPLLLTITELANKLAKLNKVFGDRINIEKYKQEAITCLCYIYCWNLLLAFCESSPSAVKNSYYIYLKENKFIDEILHVLFMILPENRSASDIFSRLVNTKFAFSEYPTFSNRFLEENACMLYLRLFESIPALVRQWHNNQNRGIGVLVKDFTSTFVSRILIAREMERTNKAADSLDEDFSISLRANIGELIATYNHNDIVFEVVISFSMDTPLTPVSIIATRKIGADEAKWRRWLLNMTTFLSHQNGSLVDSLKIWKSNILKQFEGVEECTICYSILHATNYQMPKLECSTCRKKFHPTCLYKWFKTSNKPTCPLCRGYF